MADAPERIWAATPADGKMKPETMYGWTTSEHLAEWKLDNDAEIELGCDDPLAYVEYIRADLCADPALLAGAVERIGQARLLLDTGAVCMSETFDYQPATILHILSELDAALVKLENRHDR